jgi:hypothetical protein
MLTQPTTRRGVGGLLALLGIRPTAPAVSATSTSSPAASNIANAMSAPAEAPTIEPAWDALTDPLVLVHELQWLQDAVRYLLVARLRDPYGSDPLAGGWAADPCRNVGVFPVRARGDPAGAR